MSFLFLLLAVPAKMVKRLERMLESKKEPDQPVVPCAKVDIGNGVLVDRTILQMLERQCQSSPGKFARALLRNVFTEEELRGKSLYGMKNNVQKGLPVKEALDPVRLSAVIGYTCDHFPGVNVAYLKNSLAALLARELK
ncbi:uncharacterized protein LOC144116297 [Amblyomma americanum]